MELLPFFGINLSILVLVDLIEKIVIASSLEFLASQPAVGILVKRIEVVGCAGSAGGMEA